MHLFFLLLATVAAKRRISYTQRYVSICALTSHYIHWGLFDWTEDITFRQRNLKHWAINHPRWLGYNNILSQKNYKYQKHSFVMTHHTAVRSILSRPMEGYGWLLHHRRRLDKSILAGVATLYCSVSCFSCGSSIFTSASSPNMYSCTLYSCMLQAYCLVHLTLICITYPVYPAYIYIHMYSCTLLQLYGGPRPFIPQLLGHTKVLSFSSTSTLVSVPYPLIPLRI